MNNSGGFDYEKGLSVNKKNLGFAVTHSVKFKDVVSRNGVSLNDDTPQRLGTQTVNGKFVFPPTNPLAIQAPHQSPKHHQSLKDVNHGKIELD